MDDTTLKAYTAIVSGKLTQRPKEVAPGLDGYVTNGGTAILASPAHWNDDDRRHDLVAVVPGYPAPRVLALRPTVDPHFVAELQSLFDGARA